MADKKKLMEAVDLTYERLGADVICKACGATAETMGDTCSAPLDVECEGFRTYDTARTKALHDVGFFGRKKPA